MFIHAEETLHCKSELMSGPHKSCQIATDTLSAIACYSRMDKLNLVVTDAC